MSATRAAVIGSPVAHSLSPVIHNAVFSAMARDCRYEAIDTTKDDLGALMKMARTESFIGLSVTMPLKEHVIDFLDEVSDDARLLRAVNCVTFRDGRAIGHNTDGFGCVQALRDHGVSGDLRGLRAVLFGAGGTARAIALALVRAGVSVRVVNRTAESAVLLVEMVSAVDEAADIAVGTEEDCVDADIVVNATSVGMNKDSAGRMHGEHVVCDVARLSSRHLVMDAVYQPLETALLAAARAGGARVVDGLWMLVWQAVQQQALWFGIPSTDFSAMAGTMRAAAEQELARRRQ